MESQQQMPPEAVKPKGTRVRSSSYPAYAIEPCIEFTRKIDREFSDAIFTPADTIGKHLQMSGGSFLTLLSSSREYGLLEMKQKEGYKPSALFRKIKRPLPDENERDLLSECLSRPTLYQKLLADFANKPLPSVGGLANIIDRKYEVRGEGSIKAAKAFLKNLSSLEMIGADNVLQINGGITPIEEVTNEEAEAVKPLPIDGTANPMYSLMPPAETISTQNDRHYAAEMVPTAEIPIFLTDGREGKLILPKSFTESDLQRVVKVINAYLP